MDANYCTVADVKVLLEKKPGAIRDDGLLQLLTNGACAAARKFIAIDVLSATATELYSGSGTATLVLRRRPISAVAFVKFGAPGTTRTTLALNTQYVWDTRSIILMGGTFGRGVQNFEIQYTAGLVDIPGDLREKCAKLAATRFRELDRLGETSKAMGGATINYEAKDFPVDVRQVFEAYQNKLPV